MRLSGKLIAIDNNHTNTIFSITLRRVLFRPNFIGYRRLKYRSTLIVHKCIILAVQNNTSRHIHARQYTGANGNTPEKHTKKKTNYITITIEIVNNMNGVTIMYNIYFLYLKLMVLKTQHLSNLLLFYLLFFRIFLHLKATKILHQFGVQNSLHRLP